MYALTHKKSLMVWLIHFRRNHYHKNNWCVYPCGVAIHLCHPCLLFAIALGRPHLATMETHAVIFQVCLWFGRHYNIHTIFRDLLQETRSRMWRLGVVFTGTISRKLRFPIKSSIKQIYQLQRLSFNSNSITFEVLSNITFIVSSDS